MMVSLDYAGMPYAPKFHLQLKDVEEKNKKAYGDENTKLGEQVPVQVDYITSKG